jgi:hypothetical protein
VWLWASGKFCCDIQGLNVAAGLGRAAIGWGEHPSNEPHHCRSCRLGTCGLCGATCLAAIRKRGEHSFPCGSHSQFPGSKSWLLFFLSKVRALTQRSLNAGVHSVFPRFSP